MQLYNQRNNIIKEDKKIKVKDITKILITYYKEKVIDYNEQDVFLYKFANTIYQEKYCDYYDLLESNLKTYNHHEDILIYLTKLNHKNDLLTIIEIIVNLSYQIIYTRDQTQKLITKLNALLRRLHNGYHIHFQDDLFIVVENPTYENKHLVKKAIDSGETDLINIIHAYYNLENNMDMKKHAILDITGKLEKVRKQLNSIGFTNADDKRIFEIVNRCNIRHCNDNQIQDYNSVIWYDFIFHITLNTYITYIELSKATT